MRQLNNGSWSHYVPYVSMKFKLAEAEAQLMTLRDLGEAIWQQRNSLRQLNDLVAEPAMMAASH